MRQPRPNDSGSPVRPTPDMTQIAKPSTSTPPATNWRDHPVQLLPKHTESEATVNNVGQPINPTIIKPDKPLGSALRKRFAFNISLIAAVSVGGVFLIIALTCVIYRCMRRDEGSYNVEESLAYTGEPTRPMSPSNNRIALASPKTTEMPTKRNMLTSSTIGNEQLDVVASCSKPKIIVSINELATNMPSDQIQLIALVDQNKTIDKLPNCSLDKPLSPLHPRLSQESTLSVKIKSTPQTGSQEWYV